MASDSTHDACETPAPKHWGKMAQNWRRLGPPLRPCDEDVRRYQRTLDHWHADHRRAPAAAILGVTPEIHGLAWPDGTTLLAVDRSQEMIDAAWPGRPDQVMQADWLDANVADDAWDLVFCDGGLVLLNYPEQQAQLAKQLRRWVRPGGRVHLRLFTPSTLAGRESLDDVWRELDAGKIDNLNHLKIRLWGALQVAPDHGAPMRAVWQAVHDVTGGDLAGFAMKRHWNPEHVLAISAYRDSAARYHLGTTDQVRALFCDVAGGFRLLDSYTPNYPCGRHCPHLVLQRE